MAERKKILIIRLGAIGDVVRTLPTLHLVRTRFPDALIAWAVEEKSADVLEENSQLNEIIIVPRKKWAQLTKNPFRFPRMLSEVTRFLQEMQKKNFDTVLDLHASIKSGIISFATGAPERIGYTAGHSRELNFLFNNVRLPLRQRRISRMERNFTLLKHLGIVVDSTTEIKAEIAVGQDDRQYIDLFLKGKNIDSAKKVIIFPGASKRQAYKKWGAENYISLLQLLLSKTDLIPIVAWGPEEFDECKGIAESVNCSRCEPSLTDARQDTHDSPAAGEPASGQNHMVHLAPRTTLKQLAELIRRCDLFIGGDTSAMHISCAVGTPCLVMYGPTDPVINAPWGKKFKIVHDEVDCSPCRKRRCKKRKCFERITPDVVFASVESFMKEI